MKILVTGSHGQLGTELRHAIEREGGFEAVYIDIDTLDLRDRAGVEAFIRAGEFTHIVNCAAYTAVDRAEEEKSACAEANIDAVANLARLADELNYKIIHISTDYVFDGHAYKPYTESDKVNPMTHYGATKRKGETALIGLAPSSIIIRTGWLYSPFGHNFVKTIMAKAQSADTLHVVNDQIGTPTYAADLAAAILTILKAPQWVPGIVNYSNEGVASWYDFAVAIVKHSGATCRVQPILSKEFPTPAIRPHFSVLNKCKFRATYGVDIPHWEESLIKCVERIKKGEDQ